MKLRRTLGVLMAVGIDAHASQQDTYALETGKSGAARLDYQSSLVNQLSINHIKQVGIAPGQILYDVGCGTGGMTIHLAELVGPSGHVYAIDRSQDQLDLAKKKVQEAGLQNVTFLQVDVATEDIPRLAPVDGVFVRMLLMHLKDPFAAVNKLTSLIKAAGVLILHEPVNQTNYSEDGDEIAPLREALLALGAARGLDYNMGLRLEELARKAGLQVLDRLVDHVIMEPAVAKPFLELSLNEWGRIALKDGIIDQAKFDRCMHVAQNLNARFHLANQVCLTAIKPN